MNPRNVTAALMGDPPPGRSALDAVSPPTTSAPGDRLSKPAPPSQAATPALGSDEKGPAPKIVNTLHGPHDGLITNTLHGPILSPAINSLAPIKADAVHADVAERFPTIIAALAESEAREAFRPIEPIELHLEESPDAPPTGAPVFLDVDPRSLMVEAAYQRDLTPKSLAHIRKIATGWDWRKFRPPVVVMTDDGGLILDGQHTAIAAASRPDLPTIPVQLVDAPDVADRAQAFIGLNTGQLAHSPVGLHKAAVAAGDVTACAVQRICGAAGVTVRAAFGGARWRPGDTAAVAGVRAMLASVGERKAILILSALVVAERAPISNTDIRAAEMLFTNPDYAEQLNPLDDGGTSDLAVAIQALGADAEREAKVFAKAQCVPMWRALGIIWFRKMKKPRKVA